MLSHPGEVTYILRVQRRASSAKYGPGGAWVNPTVEVKVLRRQPGHSATRQSHRGELGLSLRRNQARQQLRVVVVQSK